MLAVVDFRHPHARTEDMNVVAGLVQRGELFVEVDGVWISPEVIYDDGRLLLVTSVEGLDESE